MLDHTSTIETETADAFTLFAQEPDANQQQHPATKITLSAAPPPPACTDVYEDANGELRLKLGA